MQLTPEKSNILSKYLADFHSSIQQRSLNTLFYSKFFENLLEWHFEFWKQETTSLGKDNNSIWHNYYQTSGRIDSILAVILDRVLSDNDMHTYYFFEQFSKHVEKYRDEKVDKHYYAEDVLDSFYRIFLDKVADSPNNYNIWEAYFPKQWMITENPFLDQKPENFIQRITLSRFMDWAASRISSPTDKIWDKKLEDVTENLFPTTDTARWAKILIFVLSPFDPKNRVAYVLKRPWNFGFTSRPRSYSSNGRESEEAFQKNFEEFIRTTDEAEKDATTKLAVTLFARTFTKANLEQFIAEGEALTFPPDSDEEKKRKSLLQIFRELLSVAK